MPGTAPNQKAFIEARKTMYPSAWAKCLAPNDDGEFIKLCARDLHNDVDNRYGLNAKRDGPSHDISKDVISWYVGPTDRHVECYDVIGAHEHSSANIVWNDITNYSTMGQPGTARYVDPINGGGYDGAVAPPVDPPPVEPVFTIPQALTYLEQQKPGTDPLTQEEINYAQTRAQQLGWAGGNTIPQWMIIQIGNEMFGSQPGLLIEMTLSKAFGGFPVGTKANLKIG